MDGKKVKELKEKLNYCYTGCDCYCPLYNNGKSCEECKNSLLFEALTLINDLEKEASTIVNTLEIENKRLKQSNKNILFVNEYIINQNKQLKSEKERLLQSCKNCHYIKDLEISNGHSKELKDQIAELETLCGKTYEDLRNETDGLKNTEQLRHFAERLKEKVHKRDYVQGYAEIGLCEEIDETLKELKGKV